MLFTDPNILMNEFHKEIVQEGRWDRLGNTYEMFGETEHKLCCRDLLKI